MGISFVVETTMKTQTDKATKVSYLEHSVQEVAIVESKAPKFKEQ
jgi:hypothetical protein